MNAWGILVIGGSASRRRVVNFVEKTAVVPHIWESPVDAAISAAYDTRPLLLLSGDDISPESITDITRDLQDTPCLIVGDADSGSKTATHILAGASDYLSISAGREVSAIKLQRLIEERKTLHSLWASHSRVRQQTKRLLAQARDISQDSTRNVEDTVAILRMASGIKDDDLTGHLTRMSKFSYVIANGLGLDADVCQRIETAAPLHDVGKIGIPDAILKKAGRLSDDELEIMQHHTIIGYDILKHGKALVLKMAADIALSHHEQFDGNGYPHGLKGDEIPLACRIVAVADVYDALRSKRVYKPSWTRAMTVRYLRHHAGSHFDPDCVEAFMGAMPEIAGIEESINPVSNVTPMKAAR